MTYPACSYRAVGSVKTNCPMSAFEKRGEKISKGFISILSPTDFQHSPRHTSQQVYNWFKLHFFNTSEKPEGELSDKALYSAKHMRPGKKPQLTPEEITGGRQVL